MSPVEFFADHTYRMVFLGTSLIGLVAGSLGSFAYLRKQSLISDVISHSALPGTMVAFLTAVVIFEADGRNILYLIIGAVIVGTAAVLISNAIARNSKIAIDAAMATVLASFFGLGILLMRIITNGIYPGKGGIQKYLFGNATSITKADLGITAVIGAVTLLTMVVFWKEYAVRSFDADFSTVMGFRPRTIDTIMFTTMVIAVVIGVKSVGLVLMVAFVVSPPAAARQWCNKLSTMVILSGILGAVGSGVGAYMSVRLGKVPTGPLIVLTLFAIFVISILIAPGRSIITKAMLRARAQRSLYEDLGLEKRGILGRKTVAVAATKEESR